MGPRKKPRPDTSPGGPADPAAEVRAALERLSPTRRSVPAAEVDLMLAESRSHAFTRPGWVWEMKIDGFRLLAERRGEDVHLRYRRGMEATATFPEIVRAVADLPFRSLLLDGEVAVLDASSRPSFGRLQERAMLRRGPDIAHASAALPAVFFAFDLLALEGFDLRPLPLLARKDLLRRILTGAGPLRYVDHVETRGEDFLAAAASLELEGVVGKKADSPYRAGRTGDWIKVRLDKTADFAVVGFTRPGGTRSGFGALHLGAWKDGALLYIGRVGTGFSDALLKDLSRRLARRAVPRPPFAGPGPEGRGHVWVEPEIVCEVRYREWTRDGMLRQPALIRVRDDKTVEECVWPD